MRERKQNESETSSSTKREEKYMNNVMKATKSMADALVTMVRVLQNTPLDIRKMDCFKIACDTIRNTIGMKDGRSDEQMDPVDSLSQAMTREKCENADWLECINIILKAARESKKLANKEEFPSFSLNVDFPEVS